MHMYMLHVALVAGQSGTTCVVVQIVTALTRVSGRRTSARRLTSDVSEGSGLRGH